MSRWGIGVPNGTPLAGELQAIANLGCHDYVVLDAQSQTIATILALDPEAKVHLRIDKRGALDAAGDVADILRLWKSFGNMLTTIRCRNEPELETPGLDPARWHLHVVNVAQSVFALEPACPLYLPAMSPGAPQFEQFVRWSCYGALAVGYKGADVHAYGEWADIDRALVMYRNEWGGKLLCTETNFGAGRQVDLRSYAAEMPSLLQLFSDYKVDAACWFIWRWVNPDSALKTPVDVPGTPIEQALKGREVMPLSFDPNKIGEYNKWSGECIKALEKGEPSDDPRDALAFRRYLKAVGKDHAHPHDYGLPDITYSPLA